MIDDKELLLKIYFTRQLTASKSNEIYNRFIALMEANNLLFGGGGGQKYIQGGISHKNDDLFDKQNIKQLLLEWATKEPWAEKISFPSTF